MKINNTFKISLVLVTLSFIVVYVLKVPWNILLPYGIFLICPVMHIFMMKNMSHDNSGDNSKKNCH
ncbi:TPA: hypothetical protein DCP77_01405 [Candidatus Collierbacteria bacterium]|nr:hypothetical protein [Candidatus Collierbacteria bacterium]HAN22429.1 hypothetical protein [Candidatus Collierbacteria bacterium]HAS69229.1 hypothetical protein [Candidatus Collierbacteria bacterium]HBX64270.1 hypothetical protein [Candidatus Collierbacteria bacterium]HCW31207.1 hypothetical protein [Candidatus Collierbacteria bacterium]